jgi:phytoene synthase
VAQALIGHLRAFGLNASRGRIFLPWSVFAVNGVNENEIFAGQVSEGLLAAHAQIIDMAREHLQKAETAIAELPKPLRPAFAQVALQKIYLKQIEKQSDTPLAPPPDLADWRKIAAFSFWALRNS